MTLLVHITHRLGHLGITADKLEEVANDTRRQLHPPQRIDLLSHAFRVRRLEEAFERGERGKRPKIDFDPASQSRVPNIPASRANADQCTDGDTKIYVPNLAAGYRPDHAYEEEDGDESSGADAYNTPRASPVLPHTHVPSAVTPLTLPHDPAVTGLAPGRNDLFPFPESLSFSSTQDGSFYSAASSGGPQDLSTHGFVRAHSNSDIVSPSAALSSFEYLPPPQFSASPTESHMAVAAHRQTMVPVVQPPSHFDTWAPTFRQDMFSTVNYDVATTQGMSQPSLQFHVPMTPTSLPGDAPMHSPIVHDLSGMHRAKADDELGLSDGRAVQFRTGSLSHPNSL